MRLNARRRWTEETISKRKNTWKRTQQPQQQQRRPHPKAQHPFTLRWKKTSKANIRKGQSVIKVRFQRRWTAPSRSSSRILFLPWTRDSAATVLRAASPPIFQSSTPATPLPHLLPLPPKHSPPTDSHHSPRRPALLFHATRPKR